MDEFGRLEPMDLRTAWKHEALNFTPWLAENLDRLSQAVGIEMILEDTEVKIDRFSADILARNAQDDSLVLIENQLEWSDHTHLGQILTYLAGLQAQSVIWVASGFEDAHLSAIRWLNEHTAEPFAFFAVRVGVVRIAASPMAPVFEVMERPLEWDRRVRAIAQERAGLSEIGQFRREFWTYYAERYPEDGVRPGHAGSNTWLRVEGMDHTVSQYLAQGLVGVYLRGGESRDDAKSCEDVTEGGPRRGPQPKRARVRSLRHQHHAPSIRRSARTGRGWRTGCTRRSAPIWVCWRSLAAAPDSSVTGSRLTELCADPASN